MEAHIDIHFRDRWRAIVGVDEMVRLLVTELKDMDILDRLVDGDDISQLWPGARGDIPQYCQHIHTTILSAHTYHNTVSTYISQFCQHIHTTILSARTFL